MEKEYRIKVCFFFLDFFPFFGFRLLRSSSPRPSFLAGYVFVRCHWNLSLSSGSSRWRCLRQGWSPGRRWLRVSPLGGSSTIGFPSLVGLLELQGRRCVP